VAFLAVLAFLIYCSLQLAGINLWISTGDRCSLERRFCFLLQNLWYHNGERFGIHYLLSILGGNPLSRFIPQRSTYYASTSFGASFTYRF